MPIVFWVIVYVESITGSAKKQVACKHLDQTGVLHSLTMEYFLAVGEIHLAEGKVYLVNGSVSLRQMLCRWYIHCHPSVNFELDAGNLFRYYQSSGSFITDAL